MSVPRFCIGLFAVCATTTSLWAQSGEDTPSHQEVFEASRPTTGSTFIPVDSWMTSSALRLYELGYLPTLYVGLRPWTRASLAHALVLSRGQLLAGDPGNEASEIFDRLSRELRTELAADDKPRVTPEYGYTRIRGISGDVLNDSFHFGQTIYDDYGRPYQSGVSNITGFSARGTAGRFSLAFRGEYQHAPSGPGFTPELAAILTTLDRPIPGLPQATIFPGPIATTNVFRIIEADASAHLLGHEISFGKQDAWLGPAQGGAMIWSNNAESPYTFRINRTEPLWIPGLSRITGLFRYEFRVGSLKGHKYPNAPWIHNEKVSFKPTPDIEFGFSRAVIWGGEGHAPITIESFLRSFFSTVAATPAQKASREDPGARFSSFDFSWRIPWQHHLVTIYTDSITHDNVFPISNPPRSGWRPGILITRLPWMHTADLRVESTSTDTSIRNVDLGRYTYWENAQPEGYTNKGQLMGDWIGRQGKGAQAWLTWHLHPGEFVQLDWRTAKASNLFLAGGTTQQQFGISTAFRPRRDIEITGAVKGEVWRAPLMSPGTHSNVYGEAQVRWYFRP
ncbi:capsule assembly Wzi family protein [Terriglobus roseus]|uniref:capsule assembly Wzi family protein n=1 Tax=Terriglobus roseus TaxID=392734 RepID=UPI0012F638D6|nr:capsule assembly Wzi family protein [Terriglobus roseus]